jgi:uncharacterized protein
MLAAATAAGALNSVAGGGSFLTFPTLVWTGVEPIAANIASTVALWPGSVASAAGYRKELSFERRLVLWLGAISLAGGVAGALLLVRTPSETFRRVLPFLLLTATVVFTFGDSIQRKLTEVGQRAGFKLSEAIWPAVVAQVPISVYGGYFGGGIGLMMLAAFAALGMRDIHRMNGIKSVLAALMNGSAIATFVATGAVPWAPALLMAVGAIGGGYGGARLARRIDPRWVRRFVVAVGWALTGYFFLWV